MLRGSDLAILGDDWCKKVAEGQDKYTLYVVTQGRNYKEVPFEWPKDESIRLSAHYKEGKVAVSISTEQGVNIFSRIFDAPGLDEKKITKTSVITHPGSINPVAILTKVKEGVKYQAKCNPVHTEETFGLTRKKHFVAPLNWEPVVIHVPTITEGGSTDSPKHDAANVVTTTSVKSWFLQMLTEYPKPTVVVATVVLLLLIISAFSVGTCILACFPARSVVIVSVPCSICNRKIECFSNEDDEVVFVSSNEERGGDYKKLVDLHRSLSKGRPEGGLIHCTFCDEARLQGEDPAAYRDLGIELAQRRVSTVSEKYHSTEPLEETMARPCETQGEYGHDPSAFHDLGAKLVKGSVSTVSEKYQSMEPLEETMFRPCETQGECGQDPNSFNDIGTELIKGSVSTVSDKYQGTKPLEETMIRPCETQGECGQDPNTFNDLGTELVKGSVSTVSEKYQSTEPLEETMTRPCETQSECGQDPNSFNDLGTELVKGSVSTVSEKYQSTEPLEETMIRPCETQSECGQDPNSFHVDFHDLGTELVNGIESTVAATCDQPL